MSNKKHLSEKFAFLGSEFLAELDNCAVIAEVKARTEIIAPGQRINNIPILLSGSVKVYTLNDGRELLYYYIKPGESCIMTVASIFQNSISRIYAYAEEHSKFALIPVSDFLRFVKKYPLINTVFYEEYDTRFTALMDMVNDAVYHKLDIRVFNYIQKQVELTGTNPVMISHKEIATGLGTVREVVSRVLKKLVNEGHVVQHKYGIELLNKKKVSP
ncbi:Crp/Fnr family transcriptional regulator [Paenimyroides baculatum]|uniref:Crp/Fnr family transcriptional regulator n=1 Tax=Paenimyroides baculatum TaxID=2608000 RepID=A0A5M6CEU4_9FLAO|nr:Crp/Fnr family transcriptional regulator [Paenimyroides baculatum]KAA5531965.1 Crp/Fnr family transcriptional regulator [Paenimyroides baculatum]